MARNSFAPIAGLVRIWALTYLWLMVNPGLANASHVNGTVIGLSVIVSLLTVRACSSRCAPGSRAQKYAAAHFDSTHRRMIRLPDLFANVIVVTSMKLNFWQILGLVLLIIALVLFSRSKTADHPVAATSALNSRVAELGSEKYADVSTDQSSRQRAARNVILVL